MADDTSLFTQTEELHHLLETAEASGVMERADLLEAAENAELDAGDVEALVRELEEGPARRREALAAELAIRTKGQVQVAWDALGRRQGRELAEASGAGARASTRPQGMGAR